MQIPAHSSLHRNEKRLNTLLSGANASWLAQPKYTRNVIYGWLVDYFYDGLFSWSIITFCLMCAMCSFYDRTTLRYISFGEKDNVAYIYSICVSRLVQE